MKINEKKMNRKTDSGITLVALVITIIVMLILATVTISIIINSGLVEKAQEAVNQHKASEEEEKGKIQEAENEINKYMIDNSSED